MKIIFCVVLLFIFNNSGLIQENQKINSVQNIIDDMKLCGEGIPHGVPDRARWKNCPRIGRGNNPKNFKAVIPWGQVYQSATEPSLSINTRVNIRNINIWYLSLSTHKWILWTGSIDVQGAHYVEDFVDDVHIPVDSYRNESDGSMSVKMIPNYNFHFWSKSGRVPIDSSDVKAVWSYCEARLIPDDETLPDDRDKASYLLSMGADYWLSLNNRWNGVNSNGDIGIGRFKKITNEWKAYNMHTMDENTIQNNPPPFK